MLIKPKTQGLLIYKYTENNDEVDYDLNLLMQAKNGDSCTLNYLNPKCPFAEFTSDVLIG